MLQETLPILDVLGPAHLAYLPPDAAPWPHESVDDHVRVVPPSDPLLDKLLTACTREEVGESGMRAITSSAFVLSEAGAVLAAAGYQHWRNGTAHLCVITHPRARGAGLGRRVAAAATRNALQQRLLPQWRARPAPSVRVAQALGYQVLGRQLSVRLPTRRQPTRNHPGKRRRISPPVRMTRT